MGGSSCCRCDLSWPSTDTRLWAASNSSENILIGSEAGQLIRLRLGTLAFTLNYAI